MKPIYLLMITLLLTSKVSANVSESGSFITIDEVKPEAAIVLFPGAFVAPGAYVDLALELQSAAKVPTKVFISKFVGNFANPVQGNWRVDAVVKEMQDLGFEDTEKRVFLAGHSQGGIMGADSAESKNLGGLILLGSYLAETPLLGNSFEDFPIPTLTLGGEIDGLTGFNYLAREYSKMQKLPVEKQWNKPVIILDKVNHMQFADNSYLEGDLEAGIPTQEAHAKIADVVSSFIALQLGQIDESKESLRKYLERSDEILNPLLIALESDDTLCLEGQKSVAGLKEQDWMQLKVEDEPYRTKASYGSYISPSHPSN